MSPKPRTPDQADPSGELRRLHAAALAQHGLEPDPRLRPPPAAKPKGKGTAR